jgi:hypothetical protein
MSWLDSLSLESMKVLNNRLTLAFVIAGVVVAVLGLLAWYTSSRVSTLQDARDNERTAAAKNVADALRERLQVAESTAGQAQTEARALAEANKPRVLSNEARGLLANALNATPRGPVSVRAVASDRETYVFAQQIYGVFKGAGWPMLGGVDSITQPGSPAGVVVRIENLKQPPPQIGTVRQALRQAGVAADYQRNVILHPHEVEIFVGSKP